MQLMRASPASHKRAGPANLGSHPAFRPSCEDLHGETGCGAALAPLSRGRPLALNLRSQAHSSREDCLGNRTCNPATPLRLSAARGPGALLWPRERAHYAACTPPSWRDHDHDLALNHPPDLGKIYRRRWPGRLTDVSQGRWMCPQRHNEPGCWQRRPAAHQPRCRPIARSWYHSQKAAVAGRGSCEDGPWNSMLGARMRHFASS
jgi:hypothetical protein